MADSDDKKADTQAAVDPAVNVIRAKIDALYKSEPSAKEEVIEAVEAGPHRSKHEKFMYELSTSGKSLAEIQTAWHNYYVNLTDKEKHEVWQEFYNAHDKAKAVGPTEEKPPADAPKPHHHKQHEESKHDNRTVADVRKNIVKKAFKDSKLAKNHHVRSIMFGLGMGSIVILLFLFSFFNERFIAPFITPSRSVSSTPIIIDPDSAAVGQEPKIIIPKINVEIPVVYPDTIDEATIQKNLEDGVVHMANTPKPGEKGNTAIVGHSSNNLFNQGKYKFAFVLLNRLEEGDTFYINRNGTRYAYKVYEKKIVAPDDVSVLGGNDKTATATLITCDPPGTSLNRLIVVGEQISPDPNKNSKSTAQGEGNQEPTTVPGNAPSLWSRITDAIF